MFRRGRGGDRLEGLGRHSVPVYCSYVTIQVELEAGAVRAVRALKVPLTSVGQHVVS